MDKSEEIKNLIQTTLDEPKHGIRTGKHALGSKKSPDWKAKRKVKQKIQKESRKKNR